MAAPAPQTGAAPDVAANLATVRARIDEAARGAGREEAAVVLVAVTKVHGPERIKPALVAGHQVFGENRVQEAHGKWPALKERYADVELHLIGPLQTNKVKEAVALFDVIETVDREKLARVLAREAERTGRRLRVYVQVNTGEEAQKAGVAPDETDALVELCRDELGLEVAGLMCIPPVEDEAGLHFALLGEIAARNGLAGLSMGMSGDYEIAVATGATSVRVGSAIFGARPAPQAA
jgi:pyridoxal phosphate enzyme (YggS family)